MTQPKYTRKQELSSYKTATLDAGYISIPAHFNEEHNLHHFFTICQGYLELSVRELSAIILRNVNNNKHLQEEDGDCDGMKNAMHKI